MRKNKIILLIILLMWGCYKKDNNKICKDIAINYAVDFLNNVSGYDSDKEYFIECRLKTENDNYPQFYKLIENDNTMLYFVIDDEGIGELNTTFNDTTIAIYKAEESSDKSEYDYIAGKFMINDRLYLDSVENINIFSSYMPTKQEYYQKIRNAVDANAFLYEIIENDVIEVYEHINVIAVVYDKINNEIISDSIDTRYYPIAVNNEIIGLICVDESRFDPSGATFIDEKLAELIEKKQRFIVALNYPSAIQQGYCISSNSDTYINSPMILKKSYSQLKTIADTQTIYEILFTYNYVSE